MRHWRGHHLLLPLSLSFIAACQGSSEDQLRQMRRELASWDSTAALASELARQRALPETYLRQLNQVSKEGREQARREAARLSR